MGSLVLTVGQNSCFLRSGWETGWGDLAAELGTGYKKNDLEITDHETQHGLVTTGYGMTHELVIDSAAVHELEIGDWHRQSPELFGDMTAPAVTESRNTLEISCFCKNDEAGNAGLMATKTLKDEMTEVPVTDWELGMESFRI